VTKSKPSRFAKVLAALTKLGQFAMSRWIVCHDQRERTKFARNNFPLRRLPEDRRRRCLARACVDRIHPGRRYPPRNRTP
jgi:hypothetical protein